MSKITDDMISFMANNGERFGQATALMATGRVPEAIMTAFDKEVSEAVANIAGIVTQRLDNDGPAVNVAQEAGIDQLGV